MITFGFSFEHPHEVNQAKLLVRSLETHFSIGPEAQILFFTPTHLPIDVSGLDRYHRTVDVPAGARTLPFAYKVYAAAALEAMVEGPLVWLDVGSVILQPFRIPSTPEILINPVDIRNIGDLYPRPRSAFWSLLKSYFDLPHPEAPVMTRVTREEIYSYFNIGMIIINQNRHCFALATQALDNLLKQESIHHLIDTSSRHAIFLHQAVMTCAILKCYPTSSRGALPVGLNYPLHLQEKIFSPLSLHQLLSIRYEDYFETHEIPQPWQPLFGDLLDASKTVSS